MSRTAQFYLNQIEEATTIDHFEAVKANVNLNQELNGIELSFAAKPDSNTLAAVKEHGFRWSPKNKIWYAKQTPEHMQFAQSLGEITSKAATKATTEVINLDNLGVKPDNFSYYGAELAKLIRNDLKNRGVKGVTVRSDRSGYTPSITLTIKATPEDLTSLEEAAERYNISHFTCDIDSNNGVYTGGRYLYYNEYNTMTEEQKEAAYYNYLSEQIKHISGVNHYNLIDNRAFYWELTTAFYNKVVAVFKIANQWNYDNSDSMSDYFDVGYYLDIDIKKSEDFEPRATMTEAERTAYEEEKRQEIEEQERLMKEYEEKKERDRIEAEKYNKWLSEATERIYNNIIVEDLEESEQYFITDLKGGIGKECSIEEIKETIKEYPHTEQLALITRKIVFTDSEALADFSKLLLHDFDFIAGKGGTASEDIRINDFNEYSKLNEDQRESIKFYSTDSIVVIYNDSIQFVINPEGYSYSRYVYLPTDSTTTTEATATKEQLKKDSEELTPFYIPEDVVKQSENIKVGDQITVYMCDGWILNSVYAGSGTVLKIYPGDYAQYNGVYIALQNGRKQKTVFLRNGKSALVYKGIKDRLPDEVTREELNERIQRLYNFDEMLPKIYKYYESLGELPTLDTWQR